MFNLRSGGQGATSPSQPPTIEAIRRRARHRLIGASVLVLAGVIGLPLLLDTQPRPIPVDIAIDIPAKNALPPLAVPPTPPAPAQPPAVKVEGLDARETVVAAASNASPAIAAPVSPTTPVAAAKPSVPVAAPSASPAASPPPPSAPASKSAPPASEPASAATAAAKSGATVNSDAARAQSLLDGQSAAPPSARVVVQVGAFAEQGRAQEVRSRLERAGLKTYTHVAETSEGKRIRVRLGPFDSRAEAEKAAAKVKALGLPAAILTL
jgi:DedD protein